MIFWKVDAWRDGPGHDVEEGCAYFRTQKEARRFLAEWVATEFPVISKNIIDGQVDLSRCEIKRRYANLTDLVSALNGFHDSRTISTLTVEYHVVRDGELKRKIKRAVGEAQELPGEAPLGHGPEGEYEEDPGPG